MSGNVNPANQVPTLDGHAAAIRELFARTDTQDKKIASLAVKIRNQTDLKAIENAKTYIIFDGLKISIKTIIVVFARQAFQAKYSKVFEIALKEALKDKSPEVLKLIGIKAFEEGGWKIFEELSEEFTELGAKAILEGAEKATEAMSKEMIKEVGKQAIKETTEKAIGKVSQEIVEETGKKVLTEGAKSTAKKSAEKSAQKISKLIPVVSLAFAAFNVYNRYNKGDPWYMIGGEVVSGAASLIPVWGTTVSLSIDGVMLIRDVAVACSETKMFTDLNEALQCLGIKNSTFNKEELDIQYKSVVAYTESNRQDQFSIIFQIVAKEARAFICKAKNWTIDELGSANV